MYEIVKEFVDFQVNIRFIEASLYDFNSHFENADRVMDLRAHFLSLAISTAKLKVALCSRDCDDILKTKLMNDVLDVRKKVDQLTDDIVYVETSEEVGKQLENLSSDEAIVLAIANYNLELYQVKDEEENLDISKEFLDALTSVINLRDAFKVVKRKNKTSKSVIKKLDKLYKRVIASTDTKFDDVLALAVACLHAGIIYIDKEEMFVALSELKLIRHRQYGLEACYDLMMLSMEVYLKYTQDKSNYPQPIDVSIHLGINNNYNDDPAILEHLYLLTLNSLVNLFMYNPVNMHKLVEYTHNVLVQQLLDIPLDFDTAIHNTERYNDWILTLVDLCRYFIYHKRFVEARDHLIVAQQIINCFHVNEVTASHLEELSVSERKWINDMYKFMKAHVATSWGFYAVEFLRTARENVMKNGRYDTSEPQNTDDSRTLLLFTNLENLSEFSKCDTVTRIPKFISNFDDAKLVFSESRTYYEKAQQFFTEKRSIEIHLQLLIDKSKAYKYIIPLEKQKCNKKSILRETLRDLLPFGLSLCKKSDPKLQSQRKTIVREILLAYCTVLDIKTDDLSYYCCNKNLSKKFNFVNDVVETFTPFRKQGKLI
ncbi:uncharacterized protein LOC109859998 isoform X2 [Pseudomyrmex gracilis]|uniref:uncharacterized protein LOC109859998 isoform X2 n=1 Tax=Pseudomyrmex gracilis TaxID=219809 RepID=UPI000994CBE2|nr:uncharacterized protein LOC109859998 isoform X2 [Pseudomyrmex gracilis]